MKNTKYLPAFALIGVALSAVACSSDSNGGGSESGGSRASGGAPVGSGGAASGGAAKGGATSGGALGSGGAGPVGSGGAPAAGAPTGSGGVLGTGGLLGGGRGGGAGAPGAGGRSGTGGRGGAGEPSGGAAPVAGAPSAGTTGSGGNANPGTCTASKAAGANASGTGPHQVVVETNSDAGIKEGTIFRPKDLGGTEKYPIFVWGEGGCSLNGLSNSVALGEIASHGYFVIADGTPNNSASRSMDSNNPAAMGKPLLAYVTWAIAENEKPCSAYYHSLDTTKVSANGFSCGGLMAEGTAGDPRITAWGLNSSGLFAANQAFYKTIHTPVLLVLGGPSDMAYENGQRDYDNIKGLGFPIMYFSKDLGHGGDLFGKNGGDFTKIDLAWLNWQLKGDETATGKGLLTGASCPYCTNSAWEVKSANIP